ncbi:MAG: hypothetical protein RLZZ299_813 [Pseudomonadota bacterium]
MTRMSLLLAPMLAACSDGFKSVPTVDTGTLPDTGATTDTQTGTGTGTSTGTGGTDTGTSTGTGGTSTGTSTGTGGTDTGTSTGTGGTGTGTSTGTSYADCTVEVANDTGATLLTLYARDAADVDWGSDRLGLATLPDGALFSFDVAHNLGSTYDLRSEDDLGNVYESPAFDWCFDGETLPVTLTQEDRVSGPGLTTDCTVDVTNATTSDVWYVYLRDSSAADWGDDLLGNNLIAPGAHRTFTVTPNPDSSYDLRAEDFDGRFYEELAFGTCTSGETLPVTLDASNRLPADCTLAITNESFSEFTEVYASGYGDIGSWGNNRLPPNDSSAWIGTETTENLVVMPAGDAYDVRAIGVFDNWYYEAFDVGWCFDGETIPVTISENQRKCPVTVTNGTGSTVRDLYVRDQQFGNAWGSNLLGTGTLADGESFTFLVARNDGNFYDLRAIDTLGREYRDGDFDYCYAGEELTRTFTAADLYTP